jgi:hypothetical protein
MTAEARRRRAVQVGAAISNLYDVPVQSLVANNKEREACKKSYRLTRR